MDIMITEATDVVSRTVSKHGIIHGMDRYKNRTVKIVVLEIATDPVSENLYYSLPAVEEIEEIETPDIPEPIAQAVDRPDTVSLIREFVSKE